MHAPAPRALGARARYFPGVSEPFDVHVVSHTHWDREWYHAAPRFRQRLVALVDALLDGEADAPGASFLLDGQAVVLEDYLAVRPERRDALAERLRDGRLEAGPWYVLADELIPGAESLVRNLLAGRRALALLGAAPPPVLYSPDAFGHAAALPTLAAGFGFPVAIVWRGYGGRRWPPGDAAIWRDAVGSEVLLVHLPPDGYEFGSSLPADDAGARERWRRLRDVLAPRSSLGVLLVQNGADHHAPQRALGEAVSALARAARPDRVRRSSLSAFAAAVVDRAAGRESGALPVVSGELRDSYGYTWTLQGTFGTRAAQKRAAALVERMLLRDAEPWAALARLARGDGTSLQPHVHAAWKTLLRCHPHDTLCGCSADEVARAMDARLESARTQTSGARDDALVALLGHDREVARERRAEWRPLLLVRNPAPRARGGVAEVEVTRFLRDEPVGPGSAAAQRAPAPEAPGVPRVEGGRVPVQEVACELRFERTESPRHYPDNDLVEVRRCLLWLDAVPAYGVLPLSLHETAAAVDPAPHPVVRAEGESIANDSLAVRVEDGECRLAASDGRRLDAFLGFESVADHGDLYTPAPRGPATAARLVHARVVERGPLRATIECDWSLVVPANPAAPAVGAPPPPGEPVELRLQSRLSLDAGAPFLRVHVRGENVARDHRLRLRVGTGVAAPDVLADAGFGPVHRAPLVVRPEDRVAEAPPPTAPLHRYVSCYGAEAGATLFSDGLAEYEVSGRGDVFVTLVRAVGELSRADLPERPGHAGWPLPTPAAQSPGPFDAELAVLLHGPHDARTLALVERTADDVLLPLRGITLRSAFTDLQAAGGIELAGEGLAFSTCKESEDGAWIVLRCVNLTGERVEGAWRLGAHVAQARLARLDETPLEPLEARSGVVSFTARARAVVTVLVRGEERADER